MKPAFVVSPEAADDLNAIWEYLSQEASPTIADRILERLVDEMTSLAKMPGRGHLRSDITDLPLHFLFSKPYFIVYQKDISPLAVIAVLHGARDIEPLLRDRPLA